MYIVIFAEIQKFLETRYFFTSIFRMLSGKPR